MKNAMIEVPLKEFKQLIGQDNGTTDWILLDQERINRFAEVTEDNQWIHVDVEKAKNGPFGTPIAHGLLVLSLTPIFSYSGRYVIAGTKMVINYGFNKVRFINPVPVGSRLRSKMVISTVEEKSSTQIIVTNTHTIEIEGQDKPACVAEAVGMLFL